MHDLGRDADPHEDDLPAGMEGSAGVGEAPLRGEERDRYGTDQSAGDGSGDSPAVGGADSRGGLMIGLVLFVVFLVVLVAAVVQALL